MKLRLKTKKAILYWTHKLRNKISSYIDYNFKIGSFEEIVQVDESLVRGKRKYGRDRVLLEDIFKEVKRLFNGSWVFALGDPRLKQIRAFPVLRKNRETLFALITKFVRRGTEIHSDG
jgi:hypothetical protein